MLVVDGESNSRELLRVLLEHQGCEVSEASDGFQAVALASLTLPDLVLMDVELPRLDGYSPVRQMRLDGQLSSSAIVALTDGQPNGDSDGLKEAGFNGFIAKPVAVREFSGNLARLMPS